MASIEMLLLLYQNQYQVSSMLKALISSSIFSIYTKKAYAFLWRLLLLLLFIPIKLKHSLLTSSPNKLPFPCQPQLS